MRSALTLFAALLATAASAQIIKDPHASVVDVPKRQAFLLTTNDSLLRNAINKLPKCTTTDIIPAPPAPMDIPHHYLKGSNGPTNPAEAEATRIYAAFEKRITAGMNQYVATGNQAAATCALNQLDIWAKAGALLDYTREQSSQAWYQVEWTTSSAAITNSVLVNDPKLDPQQQARVTAWLDKVAHKDISFERPHDTNNNHHYWRALASTAAGITANDSKLFQFGIDTYKEAIAEIDTNGAFPKEMARHENAIHYQGFALEPLVMIAQFAARQGIDLYDYKANSHTLRDAIVFFGRAVDDPTLVKPYTSDPQNTKFSGGNFAPFAFYVAHFGPDGLPPSILNGLRTAAINTRIGGNAALLAADR